jgi:hypothetical protein
MYRYQVFHGRDSVFVLIARMSQPKRASSAVAKSAGSKAGGKSAQTHGRDLTAKKARTEDISSCSICKRTTAHEARMGSFQGSHMKHYNTHSIVPMAFLFEKVGLGESAINVCSIHFGAMTYIHVHTRAQTRTRVEL